jgi:hypothetical protein
MASPLGDMKSGMKNPIKKNTFGTVSAALPYQESEDFCHAPLASRFLILIRFGPPLIRGD